MTAAVPVSTAARISRPLPQVSYGAPPVAAPARRATRLFHRLLRPGVRRPRVLQPAATADPDAHDQLPGLSELLERAHLTPGSGNDQFRTGRPVDAAPPRPP